MKQDNTESFTLSEICRICGKTQLYVRNLQKTLGLPVPDKDSRYSLNYFHFIQKIIILRTFSISLDKIADLFAKEQSVLRLFKIDALCSSQTWYLD